MRSYLFVGAILVGLGVGMLYDQAGAGLIIGIGAGFLLWALADRILPRRR